MKFEELPIPLQDLWGRVYAAHQAAIGLDVEYTEAADAAECSAWEAVRRARLYGGHDAEIIRKAWEEAAKVAGEEVKVAALKLGVTSTVIHDLAERVSEATRLRRP